MLLSLLLLSCTGNGDDSGDPLDDGCGDLDGNGADTGDTPSLSGSWSLGFGDDLWWDDCDIPDFEQDSERWLREDFTITGQVPDRFHATIDGDAYPGLQDPGGGVVFSGVRQDKDLGAVTLVFGGMPYDDAYRDVEILEGFGFLGIDQDSDGTWDCEVRADVESRKREPIECDGADADRGSDSPNILGRWTMFVGTDRWDDNCGLDDFGQGTEGWLNTSLEVEGRLPDQLYIDIDDTGTRLWGRIDVDGRLVFGGVREDPDLGTMDVSFGGLVSEDPDLGRKRVDGYVFIGLDDLGDGEIDCYARADYQALKSGA